MSISKLKLIILILITLIAGVSMLIFNHNTYTTNTRAFEDIPNTLSPTPTTISEISETEQMSSPDGTENLTMERQKMGESIKYSFFTSDTSGAQQFIYSKELISSQSISIPFNTWSPDNRYFFVKESTSGKNNYYVFYASGENFFDYSQYLSVQLLFEEKVDGYVITDVTGWAAPTLLIVNTQEKEGDGKVSFWLDVRSQSFIRLGTYFR